MNVLSKAILLLIASMALNACKITAGVPQEVSEPSVELTSSNNNLFVNEGEEVLVQFSMSRELRSDKVFYFRTVGMTASPIDDFNLVSDVDMQSRMVFSANQKTLTVSVRSLNDDIYEGDETFKIEILDENKNILLNSGVNVTIRNQTPAPQLTISDYSQSEGGIFEVVVSADKYSTVPMTYQYRAEDVSAISGIDYDSLPNGSGVIPAGQLQSTNMIRVFTRTDGIYEDDETLSIIISNPTNASINDGVAELKINNSTPKPILTVQDVTVAEGGVASLIVNSDRESSIPILFNYATVAGSASSSDFSAVSGGIGNIAPGSQSTVLSIATSTDIISENQESFQVNFSNSPNATFASSSVNVYINESGGLPNISVVNSSSSEGVNGNFTVSLSQQRSVPVTVDYSFIDISASLGSDYTVGSSTRLTFNPGEVSKVIPVTILPDSVYEGAEKFRIQLTASSAANISVSSAEYTINNTTAAPTISINDVSVVEGGVAIVTVRLSAISALNTSVNYITENGTASSPNDYTAIGSTSLVIASGLLTQTISVSTVPDFIYEANENFNIKLSNATNASISDSTGVVTITNNGTPPALSINDVSVLEGGIAVVTVSSSADSTLPITFSLATQEGSASSADFTAVSGSYSIAAGSRSVSINITTLSDAISEGAESFNVVLSAHTNSSILDGNGVVTITDNSGQPTLSLTANASVNEGNMVPLTVSLSIAKSTPVTVMFASQNESADNSDYTSVSGTLTFNPGEISKTFFVYTTTDPIYETTETLRVLLSNANGAAILNGQSVVSIVNLTAQPSLRITDITANEGTTANVLVTLSAASGAETRVNYTTLNGAATSPADYTSISGTLVFLKGETSKTLSVPIASDSLNESPETFNIQLSAPINATISDATGIITIATPPFSFTLNLPTSASYITGVASTETPLIVQVTGGTGIYNYTWEKADAGSSVFENVCTECMHSSSFQAMEWGSFVFSGYIFLTSPGNGVRVRVIVRDSAGAQLISNQTVFTVANPTPSPTPPALLTGQLDSSFDNDGVFSTATNGSNTFAGTADWNWMRAMTVDRSNRVIIAGENQFDIASSKRQILSRLNANGSKDFNFGAAGVVDLSAHFDLVVSIASDANDNIIVLGNKINGEGVPDLKLAKFLATNGSLDSTFALSGVLTSARSVSALMQPKELAIDTTGNIFITGHYSGYFSSTQYDGFLLKVKSTGAIDNTFGSLANGYVDLINIAGGGANASDLPTEIALGNYGKIYVAGSASNGVDNDIFIVAFAAGGYKEGQFDVDGIVTQDASGGVKGNEAINDIIVNATTGVVYASGTGVGGSNNTVPIIWSFNANGTPNSSFASNGRILMSNPAGVTDAIVTSLALDPNGSLYIAGRAKSGFHQDYFGTPIYDTIYVGNLLPSGVMNASFAQNATYVKFSSAYSTNLPAIAFNSSASRLFTCSNGNNAGLEGLNRSQVIKFK